MIDPVLWSTVPNGYEGANLALSVVATPDNATDADLTNSVWSIWTKTAFDGESLRLKFYPEFTVDFTSVTDPNPPEASVTLRKEFLPFPDMWETIFPDPGALKKKTGSRKFATAQLTHSAVRVAALANRSLENDYRRSLRRLLRTAEPPTEAEAQFKASAFSPDDDVNYYLQQVPDEDPLSRLRWLRWNRRASRLAAVPGGRSVFADAFAKWIVMQLQTAGTGATSAIAEARRAERNAYRLASAPWEDLDDDALAVAWFVALDDPASQTLPTTRAQSLRTADPDRFEALRLAVFYGRVRNEAYNEPEKPHLAQKIAMLNNYPQLMRKAGLVFDLNVPKGLLHSNHVGVRVRVVLNGTTFGCFPWTAIKKNAAPNEFYALPGVDTYVDGALNPKNVALHSLESETLLLKMINQANSPASDGAPSSESEPLATAAANGIAVVLEDRATKLKESLKIAEGLQAQLEKSLGGTASTDSSQIQLGPMGFESLVRGYVPFVSRNKGQFLSLCKRTETFDFIERATGAVKKSWQVPTPTNGFVAGSAMSTHDSTSSSTDQDSKDLHIHDAIVNWTGWSLGAPNRLQQLKIDPEDKTDEDCQHDPNYSPMVCGKFSVAPKSLARLRFGDTYDFRLMCMDIAGNVRDANESKVEAREHRFLRCDPVPPPEILLTEHLSTLDSPGEQLTQLVIRSTEESGDDKECLRALVPPRCSFTLAELSGMFDSKSPLKTGSFNQVAVARNGSLPIDMEGSKVATLVDACTNAPAKNANPIYKKPNGQFEPCQYLPDPFASGFLLGVTDLSDGRPVRFDKKKLQGSTELEGNVTFLTLGFYSGDHQWPRADLWVLVVKHQKRHTREVSVSVERRGFPAAGGRTFQSVVIKVPYGKVVALSLHSWVKNQDLAKMQLFSQVSAGVMEVAAKRIGRSQPLISTEIERRLADLPATTIAPPRKLTAVNAVRRPFKFPTIMALSPRGRQRGDTFQAFNNVEIDVERASTGTVNLISNWTEWRDGYETSKPVQISKTEVPVCETTVAPPQLLQKAMDTRTPSGGKAEVCTEEPLAERPLEHLWRTRLHGTYKPVPTEPGKVRQEFGDTKHRVVNYSLVATTRFGEYFKAPPAAQRAPTSLAISILNTRVPDPPSVAYVVPTFEWTKPGLLPVAEKHERRIYRSERKGAGCRLWLNRPWYVTGDGEQLGLVVWGGSDAWDGYKETEDKVTRWGADPIWEEEANTRGPGPSDIESEMLDGELLPLPLRNTDNPPVVLPLTPKYDDDNQLWYVDLHLASAPSYFSFIRFALVRYQKNSILGCAFSPVTMAQFVQLTPDRAVSVMRVIQNGKEVEDKLDVVLTGDLANNGNCYSLQVQEQWGSGDSRKWWLEKSGELETCAEPRGNVLANWRLQIDGDKCRPRRLVVREYEQFDEDDQVGGDTVSTAKATKRMVYVDVLEI